MCFKNEEIDPKTHHNINLFLRYDFTKSFTNFFIKTVNKIEIYDVASRRGKLFTKMVSYCVQWFLCGIFWSYSGSCERLAMQKTHQRKYYERRSTPTVPHRKFVNANIRIKIVLIKFINQDCINRYLNKLMSNFMESF